MPVKYPKVAQFKTVDQFRARLAELGLAIPVDETILTAAAGSPLAQPLSFGEMRLGNRWCIHPMEGWEPTAMGARATRHCVVGGDLGKAGRS